MRMGLPVLAVVCLLALTLGSASADPTWSGKLSWAYPEPEDADGSLNALGDWADSGTVLSWDITWLPNGMWRYAYQLDVVHKDVSHLILQTSTNLTSDDIYNVTGTVVDDATSWWSVGLFETEGGNSNPNMPDNIYGIKFDLGGDYTTLAFSFDCWRDPVWGDFYAKDGKSKIPGTPDVVAQAWNAGFTHPDWDPPFGDYPAGSGSVMNHVLTPDTTSTALPEVPEPATWVLLGVTGLVGVIRRRRK